RVLDTCAAPGGKSTELAAKLQGKGLLFSNDISNSRALALLKNLELFGVRNAVVLTEDLKKMLPAYTGWFDKILIDAPCSGEGMFRKEPAVIKAWEEHGHDFYVGLQKEIVRNALQLLKPGGYLVYSTCTFAPCEDEDIVLYMKEICPELTIEDIPGRFEGFSDGTPEKAAVYDEDLKKCVRVFPHRLKGEGHFVALLRKGLPEEGEEIAFKEVPDTIKTDPGPRDNRNARIKDYDRAGAVRRPPDQKNNGLNTEKTPLSEAAKAFLGSLKLDRTGLRIENRNGKIYLTDEALHALDGLRILRNGLLLGEEKKNRFEPSQALAMALREDEYPFCINLDTDDDRVIRYLKGETLDLTDLTRESGLSLILADHFPLGFGKSDQGRLKNRYLAGWRYLS
ncbi:MAG: RsmB/NOP family class I SAM-dependent RNA methyltransferase, partial [Lachnospiraceae bacterium]|nr:RsmB/NOP family class I SAM-dependent RNA methyltransferase [Lachnospiraceae bacterium]